MVFHETTLHETTSSSLSSVLPNLVLNLDHQNSTFPTTLPNSQSTSPTLVSELIIEPIPIEPIPTIKPTPEPMNIESPVPNSSHDISTQPLRHFTRLKHPHAWHKHYLLPPRANQSTPSQRSLTGTRYPLSHFISYSNLSSAHSTF